MKLGGCRTAQCTKERPGGQGLGGLRSVQAARSQGPHRAGGEERIVGLGQVGFFFCGLGFLDSALTAVGFFLGAARLAASFFLGGASLAARFLVWACLAAGFFLDVVFLVAAFCLGAAALVVLSSVGMVVIKVGKAARA